MSHSVCLDGEWSLKWRPINDASDVPECPRAIAARVPGDVHDDLVRAGVLPEPLIAANAPKHEWAERAVFTYEREFTIEKSFDRAELVFDGLDCLAEVFVDGLSVGSSANAFVPHVFDVTSFVKPGQTHRLRVDVETGVCWGLEQAAANGVTGEQPERRFLRKSQFSFKWDWAPRLVTCGIWRSARLKLYSGAALRDVRLTHAYEGHQAVLYADVEIEVFSAGTFTLGLTASRDDSTWRAECKLDLAAGINRKRIQVEVYPVQRWWPAGYGGQPLYDVEASLSRLGVTMDVYSTTYGFREIAVRQAPAGEGETTFIINVNGVDVFCKGADWVPADSIPARVSDEKYERLINEAVEANFNMLRIWGGGIYESDTFYNLCDRLGVMIWHDFMFACSEYPDNLSWFLDNVRDELGKAIRRLRHHPCIVLWCGNNECDWGCSYSYGTSRPDGKPLRFGGWTIYHEMLPKLCAELDPQTPYWPSSPYGGENPNDESCGDRHAWNVSIQASDLTERADVRNYRADRGKFNSEYGVLSHALPQTVRDYSGEDMLDLKSEAARFHDNHFNNASTKGEPLTDWYLKVGFGSVPDDPLSYLRQSLAYQAMGYREAISSFRIRKFDCAGSLFWMYSDCWGTLGWTIIDYYLRRKPSFYWVRKAYAPIAVFAWAEGDLVRTYVVNDTLSDVCGRLTLEVGPLDRRGESVGQDVSVPANCVAEGPSAGFVPGYAFAQFERGGVVVADDTVLTVFASEIQVPATSLNIYIQERGNGVEVGVSPDCFAHFVWIDHPDGAMPSDNAFNVLPGQTRVVQVTGCRASEISVSALNGA